MNIVVSVIFLIMSFSCGEKRPKKEKNPQLTDSLVILQKAIKEHPEDVLLRQRLYRNQLASGDTVAAMTEMALYLDQNPADLETRLEYTWLLADRNDPLAMDLADEMIRLGNPEVQVQSRFVKGIYLGNVGRSQEAIAQFDTVISQQYTFVDAYIEKGILQFDAKAYKAALATFQQALKVNSTLPELYYWIGACNRALGNIREADEWEKRYEAMK